MTMSSRGPNMAALDPDARSRIQAELHPGEKLLWAGQPVPALHARGAWAISLFGLFFGGFSLFWIAMAGGMIWFSGDGPGSGGSPASMVFSCFPLFGLPFLLIGLGMITSPIWMRRAARRTVYAVTDRRAILCQGRPMGSVEVRSFPPDELDSMSRVERPDGAGDLVFQDVFHDTYSSKRGRGVRRVRVGFIGIPQVREVENLIRSQLVAPHRVRIQSGTQNE